MNSTSKSAGPGGTHRIQLKLREVSQLFNTMDPSPFHERDLDDLAEQFILSWTSEFPVKEPVQLTVILTEKPAGEDPERLVRSAVHHHFIERAIQHRRDFRQLMRDGWYSLLIGLLFLGTCLAVSEAVGQQSPRSLLSLLRESLVIGGWVAMWRPMEIYLYEWWPLRRRLRIDRKLSRMPVEVRLAGDPRLQS